MNPLTSGKPTLPSDFRYTTIPNLQHLHCELASPFNFSLQDKSSGSLFLRALFIIRIFLTLKDEHMIPGTGPGLSKAMTSGMCTFLASASHLSAWNSPPPPSPFCLLFPINSSQAILLILPPNLLAREVQISPIYMWASVTVPGDWL